MEFGACSQLHCYVRGLATYRLLLTLWRRLPRRSRVPGPRSVARKAEPLSSSGFGTSSMTPMLWGSPELSQSQGLHGSEPEPSCKNRKIGRSSTLGDVGGMFAGHPGGLANRCKGAGPRFPDDLDLPLKLNLGLEPEILDDCFISLNICFQLL